MTLVLIAVLATLGQAGGQTSEEAVDAAEQAIVRDMDSTLPETPFGTWLRSVVGEGADIGWSVNDCGEQVGDPEIDRARDIPMCAEARVRLEDGETGPSASATSPRASGRRISWNRVAGPSGCPNSPKFPARLQGGRPESQSPMSRNPQSPHLLPCHVRESARGD